jgi:predicted GIY-YIG superfamily endonuclease
MKKSKKPNGYWTKERCHQEALKYNSISDLQKANGSVCLIARKNGFMEEICSHMERLIKPNGYWNKERCHEVALKYESRVEFQKKDHSVYQAARRKGFLDDICGHMEKLVKPNGYWTQEKCHEEALKYNRIVDFQRGSSSAYHAALKKGFLDKICGHINYVCTPHKKVDYEHHKKIALNYNNRRDLNKNHPSIYQMIIKRGWKELLDHMEYIFLPNGYWTKEKISEIALKYDNFKDFKKNDLRAYEAMCKKGWKEELCQHFKENPNDWTKKENCIRVALECITRSELYKKFPGAYHSALKNCWLDEICQHMGPKSSLNYRYIYAFEFDDNHVYVGLTHNMNKRLLDHISGKNSKKSQANKHWEKTESCFEFKLVYPESFDMNEAGLKENEAIEFYKKNNWIILNKAKAGGLGGMKEINTEKNFLKIASKYKTYSELKSKITSHFLTKAIKNGWLEKTGLIDDRVRKWNKEDAFEVAKTCKNIADLQKKYNGLYKYLKKENFLEEAMSHKVIRVPYSQKYTLEQCTETCAKFNSKNEFRKAEYEMYECCRSNKWLKLIKTKIEIENKLNYKPKLAIKINKKIESYDFENIIEIAKSYNKRSDFKNDYPDIFKKVIKSCHRNLRKQIIGHMKNDLDGRSKKKSIWTYEKCLEESKKYDSRWAFRKGSKTAYEQSIKNGWVAEFFPEIKKNKSKWTYERCFEESKKYKTRIEFIKRSKTAYVNAFKNGWIDDFIPSLRKLKAK